MGWEEDASEALWNSLLVRLLLGLVFMAGGGAWAAGEASSIHAYRLWRGDSRVAEGTVTGGPFDQAFGRRPIVAYRDEAGEPHEFLSDAYFPYFTYSLFQRLFGVHWLDPGDRVPVRHARGDPSRAVIDTFWGRTGQHWVRLFFGLLVVFIGFGALLPGAPAGDADAA